MASRRRIETAPTRIARVGRCALVATLGWLAYATPLAALPPESDTWHRATTDYFEILSNAGPEQIRRTADQLDGLRRAIARVTALEPASPVPIRLYLFDDDISLHPYKHRYKGEVADMSGAYYTRPWGDYLTMNGEQRRIAQLSVFHEYLHAVVGNNLPGLPLWLEEGMAEFFSTFVVIDGSGRLGRPVPWHPHTLRSGERLDLGKLLELTIDSDHYNRFEHQGELYARSWELTHYLLLDVDRRRQLLDYLGKTIAGTETATAFREAFGVTPEAMEPRLLAYRRAGYPERTVPLASRSSAGPVRVEVMSRAEMLVALGDLLVAQGEREGAAAHHFEAALDADPLHAPAVSGLGLLAELDGDLPKARALYRKATQAASGDARASYRYGKSLLQLGRGAQDTKLADAQRHLERAVALDPGFAPAWVELARARRLTGDTVQPRAIPDRGDVALQLLLFYSRTGDRDAARDLWRQSFERRPDDRLRRSAQAVLQRMDWLANEKSPPPEIVRESPAPS